jgi:hypothetical protein
MVRFEEEVKIISVTFLKSENFFHTHHTHTGVFVERVENFDKLLAKMIFCDILSIFIKILWFLHLLFFKRKGNIDQVVNFFRKPCALSTSASTCLRFVPPTATQAARIVLQLSNDTQPRRRLLVVLGNREYTCINIVTQVICQCK